MKKVGILTIPRADNYGSVLQAFAMQQFLDSFDIDNEIIDYVSPFLIGRYPLILIEKDSFKSVIKSFIRSILVLGFSICKKKRFCSFRENIRFSQKTIYKSSDISEYDYYVVGSDQIWNTRITGADTTFFLDFVNDKKKKIAFAVSMGFQDRKTEEIRFYQKYLPSFSSIGVRENVDLEFVKTNADTNTHCEYIIDPTILINEKLWIDLIGSRIIKENYIFVYSFGRDERIVSTAKTLASQLGLKVYIIGDSWRKKNKDGFIYLKGTGPIQFLNYIAFADHIVTNSFHGTVFSVIFRKQVTSVPYPNTGNRMISFLELLSLNEAIYSDSAATNHLDYSKCSFSISEEREKAKRFLKEALGI